MLDHEWVIIDKKEEARLLKQLKEKQDAINELLDRIDDYQQAEFAATKELHNLTILLAEQAEVIATRKYRE